MKKLLLVAFLGIFRLSSAAQAIPDAVKEALVANNFDYHQTLEVLSAKARQGDAAAQFHVADMLLFSESLRGPERDTQKALFWLNKSAAQNFPDAEELLGTIYSQVGMLYTGEKHFVRDDKKSIYWEQRAAKHGLASAQAALGFIYNDGELLPRDIKKSAYWHMKAAEQGHPSSQVEIGIRHEEGRGMPVDFVQAASWYRKAADQGYARGQIFLAGLYMKGRGVPKDEAKGAALYHTAAEQGDAFGLMYLAFAYLEGKGVPQDREAAYLLATLSTRKDPSTAPSAVARLAKALTSDQVLSANAKAASCSTGSPLPVPLITAR
jgi:TPR repeat protein